MGTNACNALFVLLVAIACSSDSQLLKGPEPGHTQAKPSQSAQFQVKLDGNSGGFGISRAERARKASADAKMLAETRSKEISDRMDATSRFHKEDITVDIDDLDPDPDSDEETRVEPQNEPLRVSPMMHHKTGETSGHIASFVPIVVLVYNRAEALRRLLYSVSAAEGADMSSVTIYHDGGDRAVELVVLEFFPVQIVRLPESVKTGGAPVLSSRLTFNYRFMLDHAFAANPDSEYVIVLEDDLEVSRDALMFFLEGAKAMQRDKSIFCVSGYNDNGFAANTADTQMILRGQHFMALGWMTSREIYIGNVSTHWIMNDVWDVAFAASMGGRECVFPEVPRTKHVGDSTMRGALTTSATAQQLWFSNIRLHEGTQHPSAHAFESATLAQYESLMESIISNGKAVRCLWEMLAPHKQALVYMFEASSLEASKDEAWDTLTGALGLLGRGGGWDRLPRGFHRGAVRTRVGSNLVVLLSSASPYAKLIKHQPVARGNVDLTSDACLSAQGIQAVRNAYTKMQVFSSNRSCQHLCSGSCNAAHMLAAMADVQCAVMDEWLRAHDAESPGCSGGCEHQVDGVHAPGLDASLGVCMLPTPAAMGCLGDDPPIVTHKLCPCV